MLLNFGDHLKMDNVIISHWLIRLQIRLETDNWLIMKTFPTGNFDWNMRSAAYFKFCVLIYCTICILDAVIHPPMLLNFMIVFFLSNNNSLFPNILFTVVWIFYVWLYPNIPFCICATHFSCNYCWHFQLMFDLSVWRIPLNAERLICVAEE